MNSILVNKRKPRRTAAVAAALLSCCAVAGAAGFSLEDDHDRWVRLEVKEAFISRQTTIDFKDANSPAEFGWHISVEGQRAARGNSLYPTLYYPQEGAARVRLILVEVDAFYDDFVSGAELKDGVSKYTLTKNGDFAIIERSYVYPDAKTGADGRRSGARTLTGDIVDSVSFAGGDHTDYYRVPRGGAALIAADSFSGSVSSPDGKVRITPDGRGMKTAFCAISDREEGLLRFRSLPGGGAQPYRVFFASGPGKEALLLDKAISFLSGMKEFQGIFIADDMALAFMEWAPEATLKKCASPAVRNNPSKKVAEFCKTAAGEKSR